MKVYVVVNIETCGSSCETIDCIFQEEAAAQQYVQESLYPCEIREWEVQ